MRSLLVRSGFMGVALSLSAAAIGQGGDDSLALRSSFELGTIHRTLAESSPSDMPVEQPPTPRIAIADQHHFETLYLPPAYNRAGDNRTFSLSDTFCGDCPPFTIGGWTQLGYHDGLIPLSQIENDLQSFEDIPHQVQLNQQWLYAERVADASRQGNDWGFRVDLVYGTDAQKTQAFGNPGGRSEGRGRWDASLDHGKYGWAIPQAYVEYAQGDWNVIVGHFFTPLGYEVIPSVGNFFYSHSLTMFNSEPFTHSGVLASWAIVDDVTVYAGWSAGWDTGFDSLNSGSNYIGGFSADLTDNITFAYLATAGNFGWMGDEGGAYSHSIVMTAQLTRSLEYVLQSDALDIDEGASWQHDSVGVNQYLFYTLSDRWKLGLRAEWWKADGESYNEVTYGVNYRPYSNVVVRPEMRHDWSPGNDYSVDTFSIDVILAY